MRWIVGIFLTGLAVAGCGKSSSPTTPSGATTTIRIPMGASPLTTNAYVPNPVTISTGSTVTWVNDDTEAHTSTSNTGGWDSGSLSRGASFSFTFRTAGSFNYLCVVHPNMVGTINVQ